MKNNISYHYDKDTKKYIFKYNGVEYIADSLTEYNSKNLNEILGNQCLITITNILHEEFKELHHHDYYEILYIRKGNFIFKVDDQQYNICPGDILLINPYILHVLTQLENKEAERIVINTTPKFLDSISTEQTNLKEVFNSSEKKKNYKIHLKDEQKIKLDSYIETALQTQGSNNFGDDILHKIKLTQIFLLLNNIWQDENTTEELSTNKIVTDTIEYITNNISNQITINDIANNINVSNSTISHTFKEKTGISVYKYITKKRMILAKKLIEDNVNFKEIYIKCGFNDYTSFFRTFKKEFDLTPKEFKKYISISK